jgi:serine/threonine protein kinase
MAFDTSEMLTQSDCVDELLPGTSLFYDQYRITRFINSGGFGITYLARDSLDREVVIKECFSSSFCRRTLSRVRPRSQGTQGHMQKIVKSFLNEARSLAKLSHPNIVRVHQTFEDNDTAYMAMDYIRGYDLLEIIDEKRAVLAPGQIVAIAAKLISAIGYVHQNELLHCDISPDNIFVTLAGEPVLIDFGAARQSVAGVDQKYSGLSVVKDGYSPHELYTAGGNSGPWSDIYSLAASLYHAIAKVAPANCQTRLAALAAKEPDPCAPLAGSVPGYPPGFLESIDRAMAVMPAARFQTAEAWLRVMGKPQDQTEKNVVLLRRVAATDAAGAQGSSLGGSLGQKPLLMDRPFDGTAVARTRRPRTRVASVDISGLNQINGFIGGWLVDSDSGFVMAEEGGRDAADHETTMSANVGVARANFKALDSLKPHDRVDDILISLSKELHLIRPLERTPKVFLCVALDKGSANPGLARLQVKRVEQSVRL